MRRKYNKRSDYWNKFSKAQEGQSMPLEDMLKDISEPSLVGDPFYEQESKASTYNRTGGVESTNLRRNLAYVGQRFTSMVIFVKVYCLLSSLSMVIMYEMLSNYVKKLTLM